MKVSEVGEFGLIELLADMVDSTKTPEQASWQHLITGIGDDAAAWRGDTATQLATVDSLVQDVHFSLNTTSWHDIGWKALAVNLSDIAAMGGKPSYALVSLALPADTEVDDVTALYQGMLALAQPAGVALIGGDTTSAPLVIITITVLGAARNQVALTRSAARPGEQVAVTGYIGTAAAGLQWLKHDLKFDAEAVSLLRNALHHPQPRIAEGQLLLDCGVKAAIDISDGLIADLGHICRRSRVGARIEVDRLPIQPLVRHNFGDKSRQLALAGGDDYELLFTAQASIMDKVKTTAACPISVIGEITTENPGEVVLIDSRGNPVATSRKGWEHFQTI